MNKMFCMLAFFAVAAFATPTTCPNTTPTTTLAVYLTSGFSCTSGNELFSDFHYANAGGAPGATGVAVVPLLNAPDDGLQFSAGWAATVGKSEDSLISFTVTTTDGSLLDDVILAFNGAYTGTGHSSVIEQVCANGDLTKCTQAVVTNPPTSFNDHIFFAPVASISVSKDVEVSGGINGTAFISQVINEYSTVKPEGRGGQTPEPFTAATVGGGLLLLGLVRRKRA